MRHGKKHNHLGRTTSHRKAMLANMASSLIKNKRISTTLAKAKALRVYVEPIITKSKNDTTHSRRIVFSYLQDKETVTELFRDVAAKVANRPGGYTRIIKLNNRLGDNAEMALIELVDYNEVYGQDTAAEEKKTTRRGRSKAKKADAPATEAKAPKAEAAVVVEEEAAPAVEEAPSTEEATPDAPATEEEAPKA
ncbi:MAG: 50S ribosomal protein L17 [Pedobacter sp.]|nr:MAG: 50S ribosomal protein L17 [Pedobacter sp.]